MIETNFVEQIASHSGTQCAQNEVVSLKRKIVGFFFFLKNNNSSKANFNKNREF